MLDLVDEAFDQIAFLVEIFVMRNGLRSRTARGNYGFGAAFRDGCTKFVGIITLVGEQVFER
jgi:hypothetical protein